MQDNNTHKDKNFTDRAWREMHALLDQEMPVKDKKRRFAFWWYAGGIAVAASLVGLWLINFPQENTAGLNENIAIEKTNENTSHSVQKKKQSMIAENTANNKPRIKKSNFNTNKNNGHKIDLNKNKNIALVEKPTPQIATSAQPDKTKGQFDFTKKNKTHNEDLIPKNKNKIPGLITFLPVKKIENDNIAKPEIQVGFDSKKRYGLIAQGSAYFRIGNSAGGLGATLLADIPVGKNNFSIEAGLGYAYISQPLSYLIETREDSNSGSGTSLIEAITEVAYSSSTLASFDMSTNNFPGPFLGSRTERFDRLDMHYLQLPAMLSYRAKRMRFSAGAQAGLLLAASGGQFDGSIFKRAGSSTDQFIPIGQNTVSSPESNRNKSDLSYFDLSAIVGVGYDFSPKYGLNLSYNTGLVDVIKSNSIKDYNRFFQLSMRYKW